MHSRKYLSTKVLSGITLRALDAQGRDKRRAAGHNLEVWKGIEGGRDCRILRRVNPSRDLKRES